jgi:predicted GH43/DUF377 family glycosyl hydrolase
MRNLPNNPPELDPVPRFAIDERTSLTSENFQIRPEIELALAGGKNRKGTKVAKWFRRLAIVFVLFIVVFLALHAIIPAGREISEHLPAIDETAWHRIETVSGEPSSVFDGSVPISDPSIMFDEGIYKMWFTLVTDVYTRSQVIGIAYAESEDGKHWKSDGKHILSPRPDHWDSLTVETACVVKVSDDKYLLYYTAPEAPEGNHHFRIGLASSTDGKTWSRVGDGPIMVGENEWEKPFRDDSSNAVIGGVLEPSVHFDKDKKLFRMWYVGLGKTGDEFPKYRIGFATSKDGLVWQRNVTPVLEPSALGGWYDAITSHVNVAIEPGGKHYLYYFGSSVNQFSECESLGGCAMTPGAIGYATSDDGIVWRRNKSPILAPHGSSWDSWAIGGPCVLHEANGPRMWYFGNTRHNDYKARIGIAMP